MARIETKKRVTVSAVEAFFDSLLRNRLTDNLFFGEIPAAIRKKWKSFVVVDCANAIRDYDAYGAATVLIYLFSKPNSPGTKDVSAINELESKLTELIDFNDSPHFTTTRRGSYAKYDTINDMFYNVIQIQLIIR